MPVCSALCSLIHLLVEVVMMRVLFLLLCYIILTLAAAQDVPVDPISDRKVWSVCSNGSCECGDDIEDTVLCSEGSLYIQPCFCVYFEAESNATILGSCILTCFYVHNLDHTGRNSYEIARYSVSNGTFVNIRICGCEYSHQNMHRQGRFCGGCEEGYGLAAYSYNYLDCVPCSGYGYKNWLIYFTVALLPLTVFYFIVVVMKLNVPSSHLNGTVFVIQCFTSTIQLRAFEAMLKANKNQTVTGAFFHASTALFSFVNLDFFRSLYPYNCLHPKLSMMHLVSLDFIVAFYPFFLILVTCLLVSLYDKNYRVLVWTWKKFSNIFRRFKQFDVKASLIETFATFILFSNVKILGICFDLLAVSRTYNESGELTNKWYLLYDARIEYFSVQHLPFALLALVAGLLFVVLPFLLLLLYPCSCFHRCLECLGLRFQALHIFMDAFQGCYRTSPHDLRWFSVLYLILRFVLLLSTYWFISFYYFPFNAFVLTLSILLFALFRPYKKNLHNNLDLIALFILLLWYVAASGFVMSSYMFPHLMILGIIFFVSPFLLLVIFSLAVFLYHPKFFKAVVQRVKSFRKPDDMPELLIQRTLGEIKESNDEHTPLLTVNTI